MNRGTAAVVITALVSIAGFTQAFGADNDVVIGDIDDLSGLYADIQGAGGVEAVKMAIADFGGTVLGRNIVTSVADHQNKPDIGASKFREWADKKGLNLLIAGGNFGELEPAIELTRQGARSLSRCRPTGTAGSPVISRHSTASMTLSRRSAGPSSCSPLR